MVEAQGVLLRGQVVPQYQVQLKFLPPPPGDGGDGIVGNSVRLGEDDRRLVRIGPPLAQNPVRQGNQPLRVFGANPDDGHGPLDDARLHILEAGEGNRGFHRGGLHGEGVPPALEVVVSQDGAAYDGQIRVGAHKVVRELAHKVQELPEAGPVNLHRGMFPVKADTVLVVIDIGGVLQKPGGAVDGDGDNAVVLPRGVVHPARVALILRAELAPGIVGRGEVPGGGDGLGVLLRLGEVDGDVQVPVLRGSLPLHVPGDAVPADVVGILAEGVIPVRGGLGALGIIEGLEFSGDLGGAGGEAAHQLRVKEVPVDHGIFHQHAPGVGVIQQLLQHRGQPGSVPVLAGIRITVDFQHVQNGVDGPKVLAFLDQPRPQGVRGQFGYGFVDHNIIPLFKILLKSLL